MVSLVRLRLVLQRCVPSEFPHEGLAVSGPSRHRQALLGSIEVYWQLFETLLLWGNRAAESILRNKLGTPKSKAPLVAPCLCVERHPKTRAVHPVPQNALN